MVDQFGRWTYEADTSDDRKCDCDRIADWIVGQGYEPKTSIENLVYVILVHFDCVDHYGEYDAEAGCGGYGDYFTLEECFRYVEESGGCSEFDYSL